MSVKKILKKILIYFCKKKQNLSVLVEAYHIEGVSKLFVRNAKAGRGP